MRRTKLTLDEFEMKRNYFQNNYSKIGFVSNCCVVLTLIIGVIVCFAQGLGSASWFVGFFYLLVSIAIACLESVIFEGVTALYNIAEMMADKEARKLEERNPQQNI